MTIVEKGGLSWLVPDWPAPPNVRALTSLRSGGVSRSPYDSLNLADHVGDATGAVAENRARLLRVTGVPAEPCWLAQVHGTNVVAADDWRPDVEADAVYATVPGRVCAVMTADCLPLLLCDRDGGCVAAVHVGWRGLADGVIEAALRKLPVAPDRLLAWLGPAIGPDAFEVGGEVRERFTGADPGMDPGMDPCIDSGAAALFRPGRPGRWMADLYGLARLRLRAAGIAAIHGGGWCTVRDSGRFYSYRRDGATGRMASLIWSV